DRIHSVCTEFVEDELGAVAGTAAHLGDSSVFGQVRAEPAQRGRLVVALQPPPRWGFDQRGLDPVHQHPTHLDYIGDSCYHRFMSIDSTEGCLASSPS